MKKLVFMTLLFLFMPLHAQEQEAAPTPSTTEATEATAEETAEPSPEAGNLRARELGDAFRNFQPSEEISADNAVSFPVDI